MPSAARLKPAKFGRAARLDIYSALPAITGKLELEYEGELKGGDNIARELIKTRCRQGLHAITSKA